MTDDDIREKVELALRIGNAHGAMTLALCALAPFMLAGRCPSDEELAKEMAWYDVPDARRAQAQEAAAQLVSRCKVLNPLSSAAKH